MRGLLIAIVPACITFGPLFMTQIGGFASHTNYPLEALGSLLTMIGLGIMFRILMKQQETIKNLQLQISRPQDRALDP